MNKGIILFGMLILATNVSSYMPGLSIPNMVATPQGHAVSTNTTFNITIDIGDVIDLFAVQFNLLFNSTILQANSIVEADFLKSGCSTTGSVGVIDNLLGTILGFNKTCTGITGVDGDGTLAIVEFTTKTEGLSHVNLTNITLYNSNLDQISNLTTENANVFVGETTPNISYCGVLTSHNTTYYLTVDIINPTRLNCIDIQADNIVLDCQGYVISGIQKGYGIYMEGRSGNTIRNCVINDFYYGIYLRYSYNNTITQNTLKDNLRGIRLSRSNNNTPGLSHEWITPKA